MISYQTFQKIISKTRLREQASALVTKAATGATLELSGAVTLKDLGYCLFDYPENAVTQQPADMAPK
ncbi:unnamed protein product [Gongylonema pulchrum]|uniref:DNA_pol3_beta domain-containing protein n=1 Tax=Gongylonema pulchrum TaxID=637853 RepID=A0A183EJG9_9BILA|nr:unnamed protein product [Gongylonema pulchrum]